MYVIDKILWRVSELFLFGRTFPDSGEFYEARLVAHTKTRISIASDFVPVQLEKKLHLGWRLILGFDERLTAPITPRFATMPQAMNVFAKENKIGENDFKMDHDLMMITDGIYAGNVIQFRPMKAH